MRCANWAFGALGCAVAALSFTAAKAEPYVELDVASTFPSSMPILGDVSRRVPDKVARVSNRTLKLVFHEPGVLVPGAETVAAVADGRVDAAWAGAGWFAGNDGAYNMFSSVPFGPSAGEYMAWLYHGGGLELAREMFHAEGVHNIPCTLIPPEASGWFRKEIRSVEDLEGLRMRFFGLGARVMEKLGVETQQLPPGEIRQAMLDDRIDAAEFSLPAMDLPMELQNVAPYYYFPGWHQQATLFDLYVNLDVWNGLADHHQAAIEIGCGDTVRETLAQGEAAQWSAMQELRDAGVQLKRWPPEILVAFEQSWQEVVAEETAKSPNFARVYASYDAFRKNYGIWKYFSFLE